MKMARRTELITGDRESEVRWLFVSILLLAIGLRIWGIDFGLPYLYHPDEPFSVRIAQRMFKTGDLNPHFFDWPSITFYIHSLAYAPYYLAGKLLGVFQTPADIQAPIRVAMGTGKTPMPTTWLLGRVVTATFGCASVVLVFLTGRRLAVGDRLGLLAAAVTAVSPTLVGHSRYITPDTFAVFFVLLSLWGSAQVLREGRPWHYLLAGAGAGLAASAKYNAGLVALVLIAAHFLRSGKERLRETNLYAGLLLTAVAFLATTPFAVLDYPKFVEDLRYDMRHYATGHPGMEGNTLSWYASYLWRVEGPIVVLAIVETLCAFHTRSREGILLSSFPLVYFVLINRMTVRNDRTLLPMLPFVFLLASSLLVRLARRASQSQVHRSLLILALGAVLVSWPLLQTVRGTVDLTQTDSRETARVWIEENLPRDSHIAVEAYSPYVDPNQFSVQGFGRMIDHTPDWYIANDFEYLIFAQGMFGRFFEQPERYAAEVDEYEMLFDRFDPIRTFSDRGYEVRIYEVRP